ncbi:MAG: hypothetical protein NT016_00715 [Candidatus Aenigmarchaeota archaeon]|nr:hypothetical protein [Candidatus Aenigmarchaeota archaeon]
MPKKTRKTKRPAPDVGGRSRTRREIRVERFIIEQMDEYIRLHKEHEKDLRYIG